MSRTKRLRKRNEKYNYWDGHNGRIKGQKTEEMFYCAFHQFDNFAKPDWLKNIRRATNDEDNNGIDFVVETHIKPERIFIQIKSSESGKKIFWKKHSLKDFEFPLVVLVITMWHYHHDSIRRLFFETINNHVFKKHA